MSHFLYALRQLAKAPLLTSAAVLSLALAIGANAALFTIFQQLILRPHSFKDPDTLVRVWLNNPKTGIVGPFVSKMKYEQIRDQQQSFAQIAGSTFCSFSYSKVGADPEQVVGQCVAEPFFRVLGIEPVRGRTFTPDEDKPGAPPMAVVSYEFWQTRLGGLESAIGAPIRLNGVDSTLIGVLPPHLSNPFSNAEIFTTYWWAPSQLLPAQVDAGATYMQITGRLRPGVRFTEANKEVAMLGLRYGSAFPSRLDAQSPTEIRTLTEELAGTLRPTLNLLLGAVGFVLLIACANVSNLFLASLSSRGKEVAVRLSMGAERRHLLQQFMVETLLFSVIATLVGSFLGRLGLVAITQAAASQLPPNTEFAFNAWTFAFMAGICALSAVLVGLIPALQATRIGIAEVLKDASRGAPGGTKGTRFRSGLIVVQVAMSVVLLIGSALLLVSFYRLQQTPAGLSTEGVATAFVSAPIERYKTPAEQAEFYRQVIERLKAVPQVKEAAVVFGLPLNGTAISPYTVFGNPILPAAERKLANLHEVTADFFKVLSIPVREGRAITDDDRVGTPFVCVINESFAKRLFPGRSAVGQVLLRGREAEIQVQIVGVVADVKSNGLNAPPPDAIYYAFAQMGKPAGNLVARVEGDPNTLQPLMRTAVAQVDNLQPISFFQTMDNVLQQAVGVQKLLASLVAIFASVALVLTAIGLYSVIAYSVGQRTSEIGIRMAMGARPAQIVSHVLKGGMRLVVIGLGIGLLGAAGSAQMMTSLLYAISPFNPPLYTAVSAVFSAIAALACLLPARRASRIDPLLALRCD
ncbi:MAG: ABC transporter permease [Vicinamibacteria bacterium]